MTKRNYLYDYPENRELGEWLSVEDRRWIAAKVGKSEDMMYRVFVKGTRTNQEAIRLARIIKKQKQERNRLAAVAAAI